MTTANLLNLDVDQIFEQHNVSEVEIINRKIQAEIENKREELRTMVICNLWSISAGARQELSHESTNFRSVNVIVIFCKPPTPLPR